MTKRTQIRLLLLAGLAVAVVPYILNRTRGEFRVPQVVEAVQPNPARKVSQALADSVERVLPSVVVIQTEARRYYIDPYRMRRFEEEEPIGQGSGVIISDQGYVITNNHVLQGAEKASVILYDGRSYPAEYVGSNRQTDIAVLKITPGRGETFTPIQPADSDQARVGEIVLAIGSPFSLSSTVTQGIISQKGRNAEMLPIVDFIQTSAPINPGNSGGPLVDVDGRLVGINTFIQTANAQVQGSIGIGFAVPANTALRAAELLINGERSELAWVGITMQDTPYGIMVVRVLRNSPADKGGLRPRDLIREINGKAITRGDELRNLIMLNPPGTELNMKIVRDQTPSQLSVTTEKMPELQDAP